MPETHDAAPEQTQSPKAPTPRNPRKPRKPRGDKPKTETPGDTDGKRAGRPRGSRSHPHTTADAEMAACTRCQSTDAEVIRKLNTTEHCGMFRGRPYTHIERRRMRCRSCGNYFMEVRRLFDPKRWPEMADKVLDAA